MPTITPQKQRSATQCSIHRIAGRPGEIYEVIFVNQHGLPVVSLTEWYRLRKQLGSESTRNTYLTCIQTFLNFLEKKACPWNASPERLRPILIEFHRDELGCQIHPGKDGESIEIVPTRETPLRPSTMRVFRAALRDFYLVMKDAGLYAFANPLTSEVLVVLKREQTRALANRGAPDHAGIREETREQSRRRPTAFIRHSKEQEWKPELRKELADVRKGIHDVINAMLDNNQLSLREKAVLELLQNTGARLHEIVLMTVGGYRNEGRAGQAKVVNKGSFGREVKILYFAHNPRVQTALSAYLEHMRPLHDQHKGSRLAEIDDQEPLFLTERGSPYSPKAFYYHWYAHYGPLQEKCPVRFSPHDLRHLFVSEFLIKLKIECGAGTDQFDSEKYLREREAFGSQIMGWSSLKTIDIYDQTRHGERVLQVLAGYQHDLSERRYVPTTLLSLEQTATQIHTPPTQTNQTALHEKEEVIWMHDAETMAWITKMQQQKGAAK